MSFVMLDGLVSPVETIAASVAVPVSPLESFLSFDNPNYITLVTTTQNFQSCKINSFVHMFDPVMSL